MRTKVTKKLFTVDEFERMGEAGIFTEDDRVELIEGEIIQLGMIGAKHAAAVDRTVEFLMLGLSGRANVRVQNPVQLDVYNEPLPDITLLARRADFYAAGHPTADDVLLAIEISDTTLRYDRDVKMRIYAVRGIRESWIVDLDRGAVLVFRDPSPDGYKTCLIFRRGDSLSPLAFPDFFISVDHMLG